MMHKTEPIRILYVEDSPTDAALVRAMLAEEHAGCELELSGSLRAAAEQLRAARYDLVLLDLALPDVQGLAAFHQVHALAPELPVLVFSGLVDEDAAMAAVRAGAQDYLVKGQVDGAGLARSIRHSIERQRLGQQLQATIEQARRAEEALGTKHEFLQRVMDSVHDPLIVSDLECRITLYNRASLDAFGEQMIQLQQRRCGHERHGGERNCWQKWQDCPLKRVLSSGQPARSVRTFRTADGQPRMFELMVSPLRSGDGQLLGLIESCRDISERLRFKRQLRDSEDKLRHQAHHDPLTGLPNRSLFMDRLAQTMTRIRRFGGQFGLLIIDLDRFKQVNDSLGHELGDRLLQAVTERLQATVRKTDTLARLGSDEFGVILQQVGTAQDADHAADHYLKVLGQPLVLSGQELFPTASIGISLYPDSADDLEELMKCADVAMHQAKRDGRNGYRRYAPAMRRQAGPFLQLEASLRRAIARQELLLDYQPQLDLASRRVIGLEALVRWRHGERGLMSPGDFIPLAEETGLIVPLGEWVLRTACRQGQVWRQAGYRDLMISVNLSPRQFRQPDLAHQIGLILRETGLPAQSLELEITESSIMHDLDAALTAMHDINQLGARLAVDDFGLGYSSLSSLKRFPISRLKIDQSFVRDLEHDPNDAAITAAIIGLGHSLHLEVIAEGVETEAQLQFLQRNGCTQGQGYLFGHPTSPERLAPLLQRGVWADSGAAIN